MKRYKIQDEGLVMALNLAPVAGWIGDRKEFQQVAEIAVSSGGVAVMEAPLDGGAHAGAFNRAITTPRRTLRERLRRPLMLVVPIVVAAFGAAAYLAEEPYVSTDNAFVRAAKVTVNARVAGQAVEIAVHDNDHVRQGQMLFR